MRSLTRNIFSWLSLALALALAPVARADFSLEEFEQWQRYTGWPIRVIEFPGIHSFSRADLLDIMATEKPTWLRRYVPIGGRTTFYAEDFAADILRVQNFYAREGFPHCVVIGKVLPREKKEDLRLIVQIDEGSPLILRHWSLQQVGNSKAGVDSARWSQKLPVRIDKRLSQSELQTSADTLRYKLRLIGHARAQVTFDTTHVSNDSADVVFKLNPGSFCRFGQTRITGLKQVTEGTARREITYREYEPYTPLALDETRKRLLRLETFRMVRADVDLNQPSDTLDVLIRTEEGNRYLVRVGSGYDTEDGVHLSGEMSDLNFFGRARRFTLETSVSDLISDPQRLDSAGIFNDPREINRSIGFSLFWPHTPVNATDITIKPSWEYKYNVGTIVRTTSAQTSVSSTPLPKVAVSISNEFGRQSVSVDSVGNEPQVSTISIETFSLGWDTRDNPLVPRQGHVLSLTLAESGLLWGLSDRWWRTTFGGRLLIPMNRTTVFATRGEIGFMGPLYNSSQTPIQERFRLGGVSNIRGWGRDLIGPRGQDDNNVVLGGDYSIFNSYEIQHDVWGPMALILFSDVGNVWTQTQDARLDDLYTTAGLGLRFLTLIGPIRVDFGYQIRKNDYGYRPWAIDVLLGSAF
ncbi:MAG: BamA/TamA family outer membrane protein [Calditrichaeota bacterium]|nr:BamA/TamA family outer membrane protein [Calditrichota bacterium]